MPTYTDPSGQISIDARVAIRGTAWKLPCIAATTANVTIASALNAGDTIDGVTLATGDRVLVKDQSTASQNGIYIAGPSPFRAYDMDQDGTTDVVAEEIAGAFVYVMDGTANGGKLFYSSNLPGDTLGTDAITWAEFSSGGGGSIDAQEDGSSVVNPASILDFRHGLDVTAPGGGAARIAVDEGELTHNSLSGLTTGDPHTQYALDTDLSNYIANSLLTTRGDIITRDATVPVRLGLGADGRVLSSDGTDTKWETLTPGLVVVIDGGGAVITTGVKLDVEMPFACVITAARLFADVSGDIVVNIWKDTYTNFPPDATDKITNVTPPTIPATNAKAEDTSLSGWITTIAAGDILRFNVDSVHTITRVTLSLTLRRT